MKSLGLFDEQSGGESRFSGGDCVVEGYAGSVNEDCDDVVTGLEKGCDFVEVVGLAEGMVLGGATSDVLAVDPEVVDVFGEESQECGLGGLVELKRSAEESCLRAGGMGVEPDTVVGKGGCGHGESQKNC